MVEHSAVNRVVVGSSPTTRAKFKLRKSEMNTSWLDNVITVDDVTQVIDDLSAHVLWMSIDDKIKDMMFLILQEALNTIVKEL